MNTVAVLLHGLQKRPPFLGGRLARLATACASIDHLVESQTRTTNNILFDSRGPIWRTS